MNKTHLNIAKKKRGLGWTYKDIAAHLQAKGARTRAGEDLYSAYLRNELNSSEIGRSRIEDRAKQKKKIAKFIKGLKLNTPPASWVEITKYVNAEGYRNMSGDKFRQGSLKGIWKEFQAVKSAKKKA